MTVVAEYLEDLQTRDGVGDVLKFSSNGRNLALKFFTGHGHKTTSEIKKCEHCRNFKEEYNKCMCLKDVKNVIRIVDTISSEDLVIPGYKSIYPGLVFPFYKYSFSDIYKEEYFPFWCNELKFRNLFRNLLKTLGCIHKHGIIHSDIKPPNILFNNFDEIDEDFVIIDFGNSIFKEEMIDEKDDPLTTSGYITPEMILAKEFDETIDVYALAITMINFLTFKSVFQGFEKRKKETIKIELHERKNYVKIIENLGIVDKLLFDLLVNMLKYDRKERYTVKQCLRHRFFRKRKAPKKKEKRMLPPIFPVKKTGRKRKRSEEHISNKKQKTTF